MFESASLCYKDITEGGRLEVISVKGCLEVEVCFLRLRFVSGLFLKLNIWLHQSTSTSKSVLRPCLQRITAQNTNKIVPALIIADWICLTVVLRSRSKLFYADGDRVLAN